MKKNKIALLAGLFCLSVSAFAAIDNSADANDPTKERYCDPQENAATFAQIRNKEKELDALPVGDDRRQDIMNKISKKVRSLKCQYRTIQND